MAFKAINNIASPDNLISTFLIFDVYSCIITDFLPSTSQQQ